MDFNAIKRYAAVLGGSLSRELTKNISRWLQWRLMKCVHEIFQWVRQDLQSLRWPWLTRRPLRLRQPKTRLQPWACTTQAQAPHNRRSWVQRQQLQQLPRHRPWPLQSRCSSVQSQLPQSITRCKQRRQLQPTAPPWCKLSPMDRPLFFIPTSNPLPACLLQQQPKSFQQLPLEQLQQSFLPLVMRPQFSMGEPWGLRE